MVWSKKSPLVQKNTEARISKKSASEDHNSLPPQTHKPDGNIKLAVHYVKMRDEETGNAHPSKQMAKPKAEGQNPFRNSARVYSRERHIARQATRRRSSFFLQRIGSWQESKKTVHNIEIVALDYE